uniref:Uncharacterized protein n=1 Tax=Arundo donax TaxID=35708 RepID=A0A0A9ES28_ARUDO
MLKIRQVQKLKTYLCITLTKTVEQMLLNCLTCDKEFDLNRRQNSSKN